MNGRLRRRVMQSAAASVVALLLGWGYIGYAYVTGSMAALNAPTADSSAFGAEEGSGIGSIGEYRPDLQAKAENYLLIGVDSREGDNATAGGDNGTASQVTGTRADTIMVAHLSADASRASVINFPRDLSVNRPTCEQWDPSSGTYSTTVIPEESGVKLNSVYAIGGPRCLVRTITNLTGFRLTHFAGVDFAGFGEIVDAVGGVDVCTEYPLRDDVLGPILPTAGHHTLTGDDALKYVRARHIPEEPTGDYARIHRQQVFLASMMSAALDRAASPTRLVSMIRTMTHYAFGENIGINTLTTTARALAGMDRNSIVFMTVPTLGTDDDGNETPDTDGIRRMMQAIITDDIEGLRKIDGRARKTETETPAHTTPGRDHPRQDAGAPPGPSGGGDTVHNSLNDGANVTAATGGLCG